MENIEKIAEQIQQASTIASREMGDDLFNMSCFSNEDLKNNTPNYVFVSRKSIEDILQQNQSMREEIARIEEEFKAGWFSGSKIMKENLITFMLEYASSEDRFGFSKKALVLRKVAREIHRQTWLSDILYLESNLSNGKTGT